MTTELKTLKEIYGNKANGQISIKELKAEAIKWEKKEKSEDVKLWIIKFFNLSEEDLA
jgi:hypothetical protein